MKLFWLTALTALLLPGFWTVATGQSGIAIRCGALVDPGAPADRSGPYTIYVRQDRISDVVEGLPEVAQSVEIIDLGAKICLPGLIDTHTHLARTKTAAGVRSSAAENARLTLLSGFTTVRDLGNFEGTDFALRDSIATGYLDGPRMFVAGNKMTSPGGHADPSSDGNQSEILSPTAMDGVFDGPAEARRAAQGILDRGADLLKVSVSGGFETASEPGGGIELTEDEVRSIVAIGAEYSRTVAAHAYSDEGARLAVKAGATSIEHGTFMSESTLTALRDSGAYWVPTMTALAATGRHKALAELAQTLALALEIGVKVAFGTDAGVFPHGQNRREFALMADAGMRPIDALRTATVTAADLLGMPGVLGSLEPGAYADVIAVNHNPLEDLAALEEVSFVMKSGRMYKFEPD